MHKIECCKDCIAPERYIGCHSDCEKYKKEKEHVEEIRKAKAKKRIGGRASRAATQFCHTSKLFDGKGKKRR